MLDIRFGWGEEPGSAEQKYEVEEYFFDVREDASDDKLDNCVPGYLRMTISTPPIKDPAKEFLDYAQDQHDQIKQKGMGKMSVFKGGDAGQSLLDISFKGGWVTNISMYGGRRSEGFSFEVEIVASEITVSGTTFIHHGRAKHTVA